MAVAAPVQPEVFAQANAPSVSEIIAALPALPPPLIPGPVPLVAELPMAVETEEIVEPLAPMALMAALPSEAHEPEAGLSLGTLAAMTDEGLFQFTGDSTSERAVKRKLSERVREIPNLAFG